MNTYTPKQLSDILTNHKKWHDDEDEGQCAYFFCADLTDAKLSGAYLKKLTYFTLNYVVPT